MGNINFVSLTVQLTLPLRLQQKPPQRTKHSKNLVEYMGVAGGRG